MFPDCITKVTCYKNLFYALLADEFDNRMSSIYFELNKKLTSPIKHRLY